MVLPPARPRSAFRWWLPIALALLCTGCQHCRDFPVGDINHKYVVNPPHFCDPGLGCSQGFPAALKIQIAPGDPEEAEDGLVRIGRQAYAILFDGYSPGLTLDVVFASARPSFFSRRSAYADPRSPWFDIFFGYYEVSVDAEKWGRPFAYKSTDRADGTVAEDIVRLGKADWNFFSNHIYGVPYERVEKASNVDMAKIAVGPPAREEVADFSWDVIDVSGVKVVSPYVADGGDQLVIFDEELTRLWRWVFGEHPPVAGHDESFPEVQIRAGGLMCFRTEVDELTGRMVHRTLIFGGTRTIGFVEDPESSLLMERELAALKAVILADPSLACGEHHLVP